MAENSIVFVTFVIFLWTSGRLVSSTCVLSSFGLTLNVTNHHSLTQLPAGISCGGKTATADLSFNAIIALQDHMFDQLYNLLFLDLSHNNITSLPVYLLTLLRKLQVFNVSDNYITAIPERFLKNKYYLQEVDFSNNLIYQIPLHVFDINNAMPSLKRVDFSHNSLTTFEPWPYLGYLPSLELFDLRWNKIFKFVNSPNWTLAVGKSSYFEKIRIDLRFNSFAEWDDDFLLQYFDPSHPQSIEAVIGQLTIDLRNNNWHCDCNVHSVAKQMQNSFYELQFRDYIQCETPVELRGLFLLNSRSFTNLSALVCERNDDCPNNCTCLDVPEEKLWNVDCSGIELDHFPDRLPISPYGKIKLNLENNKITVVAKTNYTNYVTELRIANNMIDVIDLDALQVMSNEIEYIDLSKNRLSSVPRGMEVLPFEHVQLSQNPFECSCDMTWMAEWIKGETSLECTASGDKKYRIAEVTDELLECKNEFPIWVAIVFSIVLVTVIIILIIAKICPYETKVLIYKVFRVHPSDKYEIDNENGLDYDLYVSCDDDDIHLMQWVRRTLAVHLEDRKPALKLFIPLRDLPRGVPEAQARLDCLEKSRRMVVILTEGYARNEWNSYELNQSDVLTKGNGRVFFILYDKDGENMAKREPWSSKLTERKVFSPDDRLFWSMVLYEMPTKKK